MVNYAVRVARPIETSSMPDYQERFFRNVQSKQYLAADRNAKLIISGLSPRQRKVWEERREAVQGFQKVARLQHGNITVPQALSLFELKISAAPTELASSYKKLMRLYHPDKHVGKDKLLLEYYTYLCTLYNSAKKTLEPILNEGNNRKAQEYKRSEDQKKKPPSSSSRPPPTPTNTSSKSARAKGTVSKMEEAKYPKWFLPFIARHPWIKTVKEAVPLYNAEMQRRYRV